MNLKSKVFEIHFLPLVVGSKMHFYPLLLVQKSNFSMLYGQNSFLPLVIRSKIYFAPRCWVENPFLSLRIGIKFRFTPFYWDYKQNLLLLSGVVKLMIHLLPLFFFSPEKRKSVEVFLKIVLHLMKDCSCF